MKKAKADLIRACVLGYQPTAEEIHEAGKHYRTRLRGRVTECDTVLITHRKFISVQPDSASYLASSLGRFADPLAEMAMVVREDLMPAFPEYADDWKAILRIACFSSRRTARCTFAPKPRRRTSSGLCW